MIALHSLAKSSMDQEHGVISLDSPSTQLSTNAFLDDLCEVASFLFLLFQASIITIR